METTLVKDMQDHLETVSPGQPARFTEAASVGDAIVQGDLYLRIVDAVPAGYTLTKKPTRQLVPGFTQGSRHCLDSLAGVKVYLPPNWGEGESLAGPCLVLTEERTVAHPVHGNVGLIPSTVLCSYQREFDSEQRRERRNAD